MIKLPKGVAGVRILALRARPLCLTWLVWLPVEWFWRARRSWPESFWWLQSGRHCRMINCSLFFTASSKHWISTRYLQTLKAKCDQDIHSVQVLSQTGFLTISQCRWRGFFGSQLVQCRSWEPSHSWCYCCCSPLEHSWCCPSLHGPPDLHTYT